MTALVNRPDSPPRTLGVAALALVLAVLVVLLAGCDTSPGVVQGRHTVTLGGTVHYIVEVRHSKSGKTLDEDVPQAAFAACTRGEQWPGCAR